VFVEDVAGFLAGTDFAGDGGHGRREGAAGGSSSRKRAGVKFCGARWRWRRVGA
jgi:hypothetical protein